MIAATLAAAALAGFAVAVIASKPPGILCPSISRSRAIHAVVGTYQGASASARLMTFHEFQAGDPNIGQGSVAADELLWVVVLVPAVGEHFPGSATTGTLTAIDAATGDIRIRERGAAERWPPFFNKLPDRAWFCPG